MAGYTRQSVADIIANAVIRAAPVNAELNAIRDAFDSSLGHKHDGTSSEGAYIPLIADTDANNKVVVDTANNRISFYSEVSGTPTEQVRIQDGAIVPVVDEDVDLGAIGAEFKDLYIDGIGYIDTIQVHENATITGDLTVNGNTVIGSDSTDTLTINATVSNFNAVDINATGTATLATVDIDGGAIDNTVIGGNTPAAGSFSTADIDGGSIDGAVIGSVTPTSGAFTALTATGLSTLSQIDVDNGSIDGTTIGATTPSTGAFTTLSTTGQASLNSVDVDGGNIDNTVIGASSPVQANFTTVTTTGIATLGSVNIDGGAIDATTIGATTPAAITGTTITANTNFIGALSGNVTGNLSGNVTGNVTGDLTGDVTGNVTAATGTSSFNDVTINGTLNMNAGTTATITNLSTPVNNLDAATKLYVDTSISDLVDSAPGTLDTLNELAAALGDDPNFSTTITNSIATKLPLAGGTMTGAIAMSTNKITGVGDPTAAQDASTKNYTDTQDALKLNLTGGTMTGNIVMGANKVTSTATPSAAEDLTTKTYVDGILGSATAASASAAAAATSEANAATSEANAASSASAAASSATAAASSYDQFDDRYLGSKSTSPTVDNDGDALLIGALYFNTATNIMYVYSSSGWTPAGSSVNGTSDRVDYTVGTSSGSYTGSLTNFPVIYDVGYVDVYLNGVKLAPSDFTATSGTEVVLSAAAATNDTVSLVSFGTFQLADHYNKIQVDQLIDDVETLALAGI